MSSITLRLGTAGTTAEGREPNAILTLAERTRAQRVLAGCVRRQHHDRTVPAPQPGPGAPELAVTSNSWLKRADMWGVERTDLTTATVENASGKSIVYAIGGRSAAGGPLSKVMAYDVATNTWSVKACAAVQLYRMNQAAVLGGKIYVSGGCRFVRCLRDPPSSALYVYTPATDTWSRKAEMPISGTSSGSIPFQA